MSSLSASMWVAAFTFGAAGAATAAVAVVAVVAADAAVAAEGGTGVEQIEEGVATTPKPVVPAPVSLAPS